MTLMKSDSLSKITQMNGLSHKKRVCSLFMNVLIVLQCWFAALESSYPVISTKEVMVTFLTPPYHTPQHLNASAKPNQSFVNS